MVASLTSRVFGRTVRLLAATAFDLGWAHRHASAVQPQVHGRRGTRDGFGHVAFVGGDLTSHGFGTALDLPGLDAHPNQFPQQVAGRREAEVGGRQPRHPQHAGRRRRGVQAQRPVARADACAAGAAVVVGVFECQRRQDGRERRGAAAGVARRLPAGARYGRARVGGASRIQPARHGPGGCLESSAARGVLEGLESCSSAARGPASASISVSISISSAAASSSSTLLSLPPRRSARGRPPAGLRTAHC